MGSLDSLFDSIEAKKKKSSLDDLFDAVQAAPPGMGNKNGQLEVGNIDIKHRPVVKNADGSISTVRSFSTNLDGREVLLPTVSDDGRIISEDEAIQQYMNNGRHLGIFDTPEHATSYAQSLHEDQAKMYLPQNKSFLSKAFPATSAAMAQAPMAPRPINTSRMPTSFADFAQPTQDPSAPMAPVMDALSLPSRALATTRGMDLGDESAFLLKPEAEQARANAAAQNAANPWQQGRVPNNFAEFGQNAFSAPAEIGLQAASDPTMYATAIPKIAQKAGQAVADVAGALNKRAGAFVAEASGSPEEALRAFGNPASRAKMASNFGKEKEIGDDLLSKIERPDQYLPEAGKIDEALGNMGELSLETPINAMEAAKSRPVAGRMSPVQNAGNAAVDPWIDYLRGGPKPENLDKVTSKALDVLQEAKGADLMVKAKDYRKIRSNLDAPIDFTQEGADIKNRALKAGRSAMKNALIDKAIESGNPEYIRWMASYHNKLDKLDKIKDLVGQNAATRERRVESFVNNLFGKNSEYKQQLVRDLDEIFGSNITERAKAADMAASLGPNGTPTWLPRQPTGAALKAGVYLNMIPGLGQIATLATASPMVASRVTLPTLEAIAEAAKSANIALTPKAMAAAKALQSPAATGVKRIRLAQILMEELQQQGGQDGQR